MMLVFALLFILAMACLVALEDRIGAHLPARRDRERRFRTLKPRVQTRLVIVEME